MSLSEGLYDKLTNEDDARLCADISDEACRETPRSFTHILASYMLTKLGDALASPKTTLAWAVTAVGAPAWVLGFLVPIRESGSMIPQVLIGSVIRRQPVRKWIWVVGSAGQCLAVIGMGLSVMALEGARAGWALLALVTVFSLARSVCSVAAKDVLGKTVPKPKRGQLTGWSASVAGGVSVAVGVVLLFGPGNLEGPALLGSLLVGAGTLWGLAALVYAGIPEQAGETDGGRSLFQALDRLRLLVEDRPFRRFVLTRALLMCSALSAPFYVAMAQSAHPDAAGLLGAFVIAAGLASLVSGPFWGRFADRSSRQVMIWAALLTSTAGLLVAAVATWLPGLAAQLLFLPLMYFLLSVAHSGVRVGRKTYVVNLARGNQRTDYVAISNTAIGVLLLLVGSLGALSPWLGNAGIVAILALMGLAGAALGTTLPVVED